MKIALITKGFLSSWGGAERMSVNVARELKKAGHEVHVYAARVGDEAIPGVSVTKVEAAGFISALKILSFNARVRKLLRAKDYDVRLGFTQVFPLDVYRASGGVHEHWMRLQYPNQLLRAFKYVTSLVHLAVVWIERNIAKPKNHGFVITNSKLVKTHVEQYLGVNDSDVRVVYNGIDHGIFNPEVKKFRSETRRALGISDADVVALYVSNNWTRKGLDTVLRAMKGVKGLTLVVVGRGKSGKFLKLMKDLGLETGHVKFAGPTGNIERFYGASDFFVLPTQYDPSSNACFEAMACGLPVITTITNGASEVLTHAKDGFILGDWQDDVSLKRFFSELMDPGMRRAVGDAAVKRIEGFTVERCVNEIIEVCELAFKKKKGRAEARRFDVS
ncbi:MAG: glycosyltransferase family 4 protein [Thermodesulfobacteriota bacterium]